MFKLDNSGGNRGKKYWLDFWCWDHWLSFFGGAIVLRFPLFFPFHTIWLLILEYLYARPMDVSFDEWTSYWSFGAFQDYYAYLSLGSIKLRCPMFNVFGKKWPTHVFFHTSLEYFLLFMWWFRVDFPLAFFCEFLRLIIGWISQCEGVN